MSSNPRLGKVILVACVVGTIYYNFSNHRRASLDERRYDSSEPTSQSTFSTSLKSPVTTTALSPPLTVAEHSAQAMPVTFQNSAFLNSPISGALPAGTLPRVTPTPPSDLNSDKDDPSAMMMADDEPDATSMMNGGLSYPNTTAATSVGAPAPQNALVFQPFRIPPLGEAVDRIWYRQAVVDAEGLAGRRVVVEGGMWLPPPYELNASYIGGLPRNKYVVDSYDNLVKKHETWKAKSSSQATIAASPVVEEVPTWTYPELYDVPTTLSRNPEKPEELLEGRFAGLHEAVAAHHAACRPVAESYLRSEAYSVPNIMLGAFPTPRIPRTAPAKTRVYIMEIPGQGTVSDPPPPPPTPSPPTPPWGNLWGNVTVDEWQVPMREATLKPVTPEAVKASRARHPFVPLDNARGLGTRSFRRMASDTPAAAWATSKGLRLLEQSATIRGPKAGAGGGVRFGLLIESADWKGRATCMDGDSIVVDVMSHDGQTRYAFDTVSLGLGLYFVPVRIVDGGEFAISVAVTFDRFSWIHVRGTITNRIKRNANWDLVYLHQRYCYAMLPLPNHVKPPMDPKTIDTTTLWWNWPASAAFLDHIPQWYIAYPHDIRFPSHVVTALVHVAFDVPLASTPPPPLCDVSLFEQRLPIGSRYVRLGDRQCTSHTCEGSLAVPSNCGSRGADAEGCQAAWAMVPPDCKMKLYTPKEAWERLDGLWLGMYGDSTVNEPVGQMINFLYGTFDGLAFKYPRRYDAFYLRPTDDSLNVSSNIPPPKWGGQFAPHSQYSRWRKRLTPASGFRRDVDVPVWEPVSHEHTLVWVRDRRPRDLSPEMADSPAERRRFLYRQDFAEKDYTPKPAVKRDVEPFGRSAIPGRGVRISNSFSGHFSDIKNFLGFENLRHELGVVKLSNMTDPAWHSRDPPQDCHTKAPLARPFNRAVPDLIVAGSALHDMFYLPHFTIFNHEGTPRSMHWIQHLRRINYSFPFGAKVIRDLVCRNLTVEEEKSVHPLIDEPRSGWRQVCDNDGGKNVERPVVAVRTSPYPGGGDPQHYTQGGSLCKIANGQRASIFDNLMERYFRYQFGKAQDDPRLPPLAAPPVSGASAAASKESVWMQLFDHRRRQPVAIHENAPGGLGKDAGPAPRMLVMDYSTLTFFWHGITGTSLARHGFHINGAPIQVPMVVQWLINFIVLALNRTEVPPQKVHPPVAQLPTGSVTFPCYEGYPGPTPTIMPK